MSSILILVELSEGNVSARFDVGAQRTIVCAAH